METRKNSFQIILPSDAIIAVEVEHMVPGSLQKLPICFCFSTERQNAVGNAMHFAVGKMQCQGRKAVKKLETPSLVN